jgi:hypothetical protein
MQNNHSIAVVYLLDEQTGFIAIATHTVKCGKQLGNHSTKGLQ